MLTLHHCYFINTGHRPLQILSFLKYYGIFPPITSSLNFADSIFIIVEFYFIVHTHLQPERAHMHDTYMYAGMHA
jgi:hypothetical protein